MKNKVFWIDGNWPGRLAIVPRPRGNDWLEDEIFDWKMVGINVIVSLLEKPEAKDLGLSQEGEKCEQSQIEFISFPIVDRSVPAKRQAALELAAELRHHLQQGKQVGIHCRQSVGRASLVAALVMMEMGLDTETALRKIAEARGCAVPETLQQADWLMSFALPKAA